MIDLLLLLLGFIPLIYGANILVDGASSLAKKMNVPNIVIGLTVVAFGTSAPEMIVNVFASVSGDSAIVLGNAMGSNIFNVLGILGISALIYPLAVRKTTTWIEVPLSLLSAIIVLVLANDIFIDRANVSVLSRIDGLVMLAFFIIFLAYNIVLSRSGKIVDEAIAVKNYFVGQSVMLIIAGLLLLVLGGKIIVTFATDLAQSFGISERIIAITIVSIGTSLPELATSVIAARKKNVDIAIGNIVGSNIFNVFFILGLSAVINPVFIQQISNFDMLANIAASILLFIFIFTGKGRRLDRREGAIFIGLYAAYVAALIIS
ncbi:MAG: sodium:proton exchanger [Fibrobacteres bacterium CG2_30_45_31]|nr:MAG: sodium:proton exchanger [Fibrobacteres bacterium CG2_30_45_31]